MSRAFIRDCWGGLVPEWLYIIKEFADGVLLFVTPVFTAGFNPGAPVQGESDGASQGSI